MNGYWVGKAAAKALTTKPAIDADVTAWKHALVMAKKAGIAKEIVSAQKGLAAAQKAAFLKAHGLAAVKVAAPAAVKLSGVIVKGALVVGSAIATIIASQFTN